MVAFKNGVSINVHSGKKMKHLRIKAGPQRDQYVHDLVFRAKIMGRRESWEREHPGQPVPDSSAEDRNFYAYLETAWETVDHHDNESLNNEPDNLKRMRRGENSAKANHNRANRASKK